MSRRHSVTANCDLQEGFKTESATPERSDV